MGPTSTLFFLGLATLILGERGLADVPQLIARLAAAAALLACLAVAQGRDGRATAQQRAACRLLRAAWATAAGGVALWALAQWTPLTAALAHLSPRLPRLAGLAGWLLGAWGAAAAAAGEWVLAGMRPAPVWDAARLQRAMQAARAFVACAVAFAALNFAASIKSREVDLSHFRTSQVGEGVRGRVAKLASPLHVVAFFPPANPVAAQLEPYLNGLSQLSPQVVVERLDHAVDVDRARALTVRGNGIVVLEHEGRHASEPLGLDALAARVALRSLDQRVLRMLAEVTRDRPSLYFTVGHRERPHTSGVGQAQDGRAGILKLQRLLRAQGMRVTQLGLAEGLGRQVPDDAAAVLSIGALEPLAATERAALAAYLARGGRLLVAQDPDLGAPDDALTALVGMRVGRHPIAHDRDTVRFAQRRASPYDLVTNAFAAHPVARGLQAYGGNAAVVLLGAGEVVGLDVPAGGGAAQDVLRATPGAWDDRIANGRFDGPPETRGPFALVAAAERQTTGGRPDTQPPQHAPEPGAPPPRPPWRAVVMGDADLASDAIIDLPGNSALMLDAVRWLVGEPVGAAPQVESEADVTLMQRRSQEGIWFWAVIFGVPAAVLVGGLALARRRHRASAPGPGSPPKGGA